MTKKEAEFRIIPCEPGWRTFRMMDEQYDISVDGESIEDRIVRCIQSEWGSEPVIAWCVFADSSSFINERKREVRRVSMDVHAITPLGYFNVDNLGAGFCADFECGYILPDGSVICAPDEPSLTFESLAAFAKYYAGYLPSVLPAK